MQPVIFFQFMSSQISCYLVLYLFFYHYADRSDLRMSIKVKYVDVFLLLFTFLA